MEIKKVSALISGGASGLGLATTKLLVNKGARVTILDLKEDQAKAVQAELGENVSYLAGDVADEEVVKQAVALAAEKAPLRICVNCAGIGIAMRTVNKDGTPHDLKWFQTVLNVNLIGTFNVLRLGAAQIMKNEPLEDGERGVVVNTASVAAFEGQVGQIAYSASKGAIVGMTLPAARDLAPAGVRVLTIAPGLMDTPLLGLLPQEKKDALGSGVLFPKRLGRPEEFAHLAVSLIENSYLNGETIRLDGGLRMPPSPK